MAQTTGTRKDVPFGGFVDITPHFGGEIPHHPNFGGINRHFQAKRQNIESFMLSKYCIDFNQILHNDRDDREGPLNVCVCLCDRDHQEVVVGGPNRRPTNPRWRTAAILKKPLNRHISATV